MKRHWRWVRAFLLVVLAVAVWCQPRSASAWHGSCFAPRPWCGPRIAPRWCGWYGSSRMFAAESVYVGGCGSMFSGSIRGCVFPPAWCGPRWCHPCGPCGGFWYPSGVLWCAPSPIVVSPFPAAIGPVYGPAGVLPFMRFAGGDRGMADGTGRPGVFPLRDPPPVVAGAGRQPADDRRAAPNVRGSNAVARLRSARLVAVGDRHLRSAVTDRTKLASALDAYRRAAAIAPDLPDTFLRQAIVLVALEREHDAAEAVGRAVAIDGRLAPDRRPAAVPAGLPPDPVFGDRPDAAPTVVAARSTTLLREILGADPAAVPAGLNWIAARWARHCRGPAGGPLEAMAVN